jgi:hypothetical protein
MSDIIYSGGAIGSEQKRKSLSLDRRQWAVSIPIWPYRIDWFDVVAVMCGIIISGIYSWYIGYWLKGMSIGMLMFIMGWMVMEWFILGDDDRAGQSKVNNHVATGKLEALMATSRAKAITLGPHKSQ